MPQTKERVVHQSFFNRKVSYEEWKHPDFLRPSNMEILAHNVDLRAGFNEIMDELFDDNESNEAEEE